MEEQGNESYNYWRKEIGKYLLILANVIAGGLVVGELATEKINWYAVVFGGLMTVVLYHFAVRILKKIL